MQGTGRSDTTYAMRLLERAGLSVERAAIKRVLRDDHETVVWVETQINGLPVFDRETGYVFEADSNRAVDPTTSEPMVLGEQLTDPPRGLVSRPRVNADQARATFTQRAVQENWVIAPDDPLEAVLGYAVGPGPNPYALAWRVRPMAAGAMVVFVDAIDGGELRFDSGIRCVRAPCP